MPLLVAAAVVPVLHRRVSVGGDVYHRYLWLSILALYAPPDVRISAAIASRLFAMPPLCREK